MTDTILKDIKNTLDFASEEDTGFDQRLVLEIDGILGELSQMTHINPDFVMSNEATWDGLLKSEDSHLLRLVRQYIYVSVRIKFDPPVGSVLTSLEKSLQSTAHRIIIQKEKFNHDQPDSESGTPPRDSE